VLGVREALSSIGDKVKVIAKQAGGKQIEFRVKARVDTPQEAEYYRNGGILPYVFRQILASAGAAG
jgi:aconitate hydratase